MRIAVGYKHAVIRCATKTLTERQGAELIREVAPTAKTIAALFNPNNPGSRLILVLLDAILTCVSRTGIRQLGARDFVLGALTTAL